MAIKIYKIFALCVCCGCEVSRQGFCYILFGNPFSINSNAARAKEVFLLRREPMQSFEGRQCPQERLQGPLASCAVAGMIGLDMACHHNPPTCQNPTDTHSSESSESLTNSCCVCNSLYFVRRALTLETLSSSLGWPALLSVRRDHHNGKVSEQIVRPHRSP